jgi:hypothetical protein
VIESPHKDAWRQELAAFPIVVIEDRYNGVYSGGKWIAFAKADDENLSCVLAYLTENVGPWGDDIVARVFGQSLPAWAAVGATPDEAVQAVRAKIAGQR